MEDAARAIVLATERYNKSESVNMGAGFEGGLKMTVEWYKENKGKFVIFIMEVN